MSDTYKHKEYGKWRRLRTYCPWIEGHRFKYHKCPRTSSTPKYIIQTLGHRRRRCAERKVCSDILKTNYHECIQDWDIENKDDIHLTDVYDEGYYLCKWFSDVWDYY